MSKPDGMSLCNVISFRESPFSCAAQVLFSAYRDAHFSDECLQVSHFTMHNFRAGNSDDEIFSHTLHFSVGRRKHAGRGIQNGFSSVESAIEIRDY